MKEHTIKHILIMFAALFLTACGSSDAGNDSSSTSSTSSMSSSTVSSISSSSTSSMSSISSTASSMSSSSIQADTTPPLFTSSPVASVYENQINAITVVATDNNSTVTYSIGGGDSELLTINQTTGVITFKHAPDYESKKLYLFTATATDMADNSTDQNIVINILNIVEAIRDTTPPHFTSNLEVSVYENQSSAITLTAVDAESEPIRYSISGGDSSSFDIDSATGVVSFKTAPDYESKKRYIFLAHAKDSKNNSISKLVRIDILNLAETALLTLYGQRTGVEPWFSDGTSSGTYLIKDINQNTLSSSLSEPIYISGVLYFSADDGVHGRELWKSDGSAAGTVMVKDISDGGSSSPRGLTNIGGVLYFSANDNIHGTELWRSDGSAAGTVMVKDISDGTMSSSIGSLTDLNGVLYFSANDGVHGSELWRSDGSAAGTVMVKDIRDSASSSVAFLTALDGVLYFSANDGVHGSELWKSDGSAAGTVMVKDIRDSTSSSIPRDLISIGGVLYFNADDGTHGRELWKSDGSVAGTVMVKDIKSGTAGSLIHVMEFNSTAYFIADDGTGQEIWKSDGSEAGTVAVTDMNFTRLFSLTKVDKLLYFTADNRRDLWVYDINSSTSSMLYRALNTRSISSLTPLGDTLYFSINTDELHKSGGSVATTSKVKTLDNIYNMIGAGEKLYFRSNDDTHGIELWVSDGSESGTVMLKDINTVTKSSMNQKGYVIDTVFIDSKYYFGATDDMHGNELWVSDGSESGTIMVKDITDGPTSSYPRGFAELDETLYFFVDGNRSMGGTTLYRSSGDASNTVQVKRIDSGPLSSLTSKSVIRIDNKLYFAIGSELWVSGGSAATTLQIKDLPLPISSLTDVNGTLFLELGNTRPRDAASRARPSTISEIWRSDGSEVGTLKVSDINGSARTVNSMSSNGLFYTATKDYRGAFTLQSIRADNAMVTQLHSSSGPLSFYPPNLIDWRDRLYFTPDQSALWVSDGNSSSTTMIKMMPTPIINITKSVDKLLIFTYSSGNIYLWASDGTLSGTTIIKTYPMDDTGGSATIMAHLDGKPIFFIGNSLWISDGSATGTHKIVDDNILLNILYARF